MGDDSVITPQARRWASREYPDAQITITARDIAKFAYATGETDPVHFDAEAARRAGYRDVVAPPMFYLLLRSEPYHLRPRAELERDGSPSEDIPPLALKRAMAGETQLEFAGRFVAGDTVTCRKRLHSLTEKRGRSGPLAFLQFEYRYDVEGRTVVLERFTRILR
ncbi:MAG: MaoC family dehydratase N-terminal domain-containing protein [Chloroflexota bacterium]|nr:MaoC family dehydratase N-terminal domain-containing protein [Chloroflexota bacterium]